MWLSYFCSRLNVGCLISHFELAGYSFTTIIQDRFFCVLWGGYVLILVQHYKRTFLEPLYKIQKLSIIDFYWLFYFPSGQSLVVPCYAWRPLVAQILRLRTLFHKKDGFWFFQRGNPNRMVRLLCLTQIFCRKHVLWFIPYPNQKQQRFQIRVSQSYVVH